MQEPEAPKMGAAGRLSKNIMAMKFMKRAVKIAHEAQVDEAKAQYDAQFKWHVNVQDAAAAAALLKAADRAADEPVLRVARSHGFELVASHMAFLDLDDVGEAEDGSPGSEGAGSEGEGSEAMSEDNGRTAQPQSPALVLGRFAFGRRPAAGGAQGEAGPGGGGDPKPKPKPKPKPQKQRETDRGSKKRGADPTPAANSHVGGKFAAKRRKLERADKRLRQEVQQAAGTGKRGRGGKKFRKPPSADLQEFN